MDEGRAGNNRERLTKDRICEVALRAIDADGLESVSMRNLARALDVKASSLYYHFGSKDELLTGVAEFLYRRLGRPPSTGAWTEQVRGTFVQLYDFIQGHPNAAPLLVRDLAYSPVARKRANVLFKIVARAGLDESASANMISNLVALLVGHTFLKVWLREGSGPAGEAHMSRGQSGTGFVVDPDGSRPWVQRLFAAEGPRPGTAMGPSSAVEESTKIDGTVHTASASTEQTTSLQTRSDWSHAEDGSPRGEEAPVDLAFRAGLDALIKGFS